MTKTGAVLSFGPHFYTEKRRMDLLIDVARAAALLIAAAIVGNWFLSEIKKAKAQKAPWYKPYLSIPGILIVLAAIGLPLLIWYYSS